ncbi:MAG TPA: BamA/TamA family outer membrane protein [Gemmatimonadaceae bacterium]
MAPTFLKAKMIRYAVATAMLAVAAVAVDGSAQEPAPRPPRSILSDTLVAVPDTAGFSIGLSRRRARLVIGSGKTYNRVEGLAVHAGPTFADSSDMIRFSAEAFGILRSADTFRWDSRNVGHHFAIDLRTLTGRGPALRITGYDVVGPVEDWQMPRGEAGIATFLFHRDYRDHFGRHGASVAVSNVFDERFQLALTFADERWSSLPVRQVLTLFRNNHLWRPNPTVDDGRARLVTARALVDTRNDQRNPTTGWLARFEYEHGDAVYDASGPTSPVARFGAPPSSTYGRVLADVRRYNRVSPASQLNFRVVAGGWLHGDELPLQRRFSVGGVATIPGVDFRDRSISPDVLTCGAGDAVPGAPAQCERMLLLQTEYREELPFRPGTIFGGTPIRIRSAALTLHPVLVAFADVGRGWLLQPRSGSLAPPDPAASRDLVYATGRVPPLRTFSADVGLGVDLGLFGVYVAKSISESGEPVNLIFRAHARF